MSRDLSRLRGTNKRRTKKHHKKKHHQVAQAVLFKSEVTCGDLCKYSFDLLFVGVRSLWIFFQVQIFQFLVIDRLDILNQTTIVGHTSG